MVNDVLILVLSLQVYSDSANSANDASYAAAPEETLGQGGVVLLVELIKEITDPNDN